MGESLVSVIIPFYSGLHWLKAALVSAENQTYNNIEILDGWTHSELSRGTLNVRLRRTKET